MAQEVTNEVLIHAPAHKVWEVLTEAVYTRQYMYGCSPETDWHPGSKLDWIMMHEGKEMIPVTGTIKEIMANVKLVYTVTDPNAGWADIPENYLNVTYSLMQQEDDTLFSVKQDGFEGAEDGEKRYQDVYNNGEGWQPILDQIKTIAEKKTESLH